ncbi:MAG: DUF1294 domain-containing protein [Candidatus Magasanikbacteria bacterium]|nr:DUF1294 domain-containing protein [Candidatus Magasanikbacteria bacterium]
MILEILSDPKVSSWAIYALINFLSFFYVFLDKRKAIKNNERIPEIDFFLWGVFGGSLGVLSGMYFFRHKTRKWYFVVGFSVLLVQNILAVLKIIETIKSF